MPGLKLVWLVLATAMTLSGCSDTKVSSSFVCYNNSRSSSMPAVRLPYTQGTSHKVSQGYNGTYTHSQTPYNYALDLPMPEGTNLVAVASGRVMYVKEDTPSEDNCPTTSCIYKANYVQIDFGGGVYGIYNHLCYNCALVAVGDMVTAGQIVATSGNTGVSTGPHLHFQMVSFNSACTLPYAFEDVAGDGLAQPGETYTSNNDGSHGVAYAASAITGTAFANNGVMLTSDIPWSITAGTSLTIQGKITAAATNVGVLIMPADGGTALESAQSSVNADGTFEIPITPTLGLGSYAIAVVASKSNSYSTKHLFPFLIE